MTRTVRRRIPVFVCASVFTSALAISIAVPTAQAAPQVPAQTTTSKSLPNNWCDDNPGQCGNGNGNYQGGNNNGNGYQRGGNDNGYQRGGNDNGYHRGGNDNGYHRGGNDNGYHRGGNGWKRQQQNIIINQKPVPKPVPQPVPQPVPVPKQQCTNFKEKVCQEGICRTVQRQTCEDPF